MMVKFKYIPLASAIICASLQLSAQLKETIEVQGKYNKEILYPEKLSRLPERQRLQPQQSDLPYELTGVEANFTPSPAPISPTADGALRTDIPPRGYLNLNMGSWLNSSLNAGYTILNSEADECNIWLAHNSTSLWQPFKNLDSFKNKRISYQEALGAKYRHLFPGIANLTAGLRYHIGYFNYYGAPDSEFLASSIFPDYKAPTQTINDLSLFASLSSLHSNDARDGWCASFNIRYFGMRTATRETELQLSGQYVRRLNPSSSIGADAKVDGLLYSSAQNTSSPHSYGNINLSPFYKFSSGHFSLRIGATADITMNADAVKDNEHYSAFHIAPDVKADYNNGRFAAWLHADGGQQLHTLASMVDNDLYAFPFLQSTTPLYSPIDARAGLRVVAFSGFSAEAEFRYKVSRNIPGEGWGSALIFSGANPVFNSFFPSLPSPSGTIATYGLGRARYNLNGYSGRLRLDYSSNPLKIWGEGIFTPQNSSTGIFNGLDRPRWILSAGIKVNPIRPISIAMEYQYRGVRSVWSALENVELADNATRVGTTLNPGDTSSDIIEENPSGKCASLRLPDITRLNVDIEWKLPLNYPSLTIGAHARNILNQREILLPMLPSEGATFSGSLQILF